MTKILGFSCFYHDSAACLIEDGKIVNAVQEERFSRKKNDSEFPEKSIKFILDNNNIGLNEIDYFIFYEKPFLKFARILETALYNSPFGFKIFKKSLPLWIKDKFYQKNLIIDKFKQIDKKFNKKILFSDHHSSHAASAYYPSPFNEAIILTLDAVGEFTTTSVSIGKDNNISFKKKIDYPNSLGMLYSTFTSYCGFKVNEGEYKLMGLAPFGDPKFTDVIYKNLISINKDSSFKLNMKYFDFSRNLKMFNKKFEKLFGRKARKFEDKIDEFHMDIAASIQKVLEEIIIKICKTLKQEFQIENLCLAGGVALNCVATGRILKENIFKNIWVQPAAGDAGGALGSALLVWHDLLDKDKLDQNGTMDSMKGSYLGPSYSDDEIEAKLKILKADYLKLTFEDTIKTTAKLLSEKKIVGWFQSAMEFGPRALGNRSILADPRPLNMQSLINQKIKFREGFRPFAPAILAEKRKLYFNDNLENQYMLIVTDIIKKNYSDDIQKLKGFKKLKYNYSNFPAITHVDYSARVQSVHKKTNPIFYNLIEEFENLTGCPMLVNTSFNINDEPIVCTVEDAYKCFLTTDLDYLICGNFILDKKKQYNFNLEK